MNQPFARSNVVFLQKISMSFTDDYAGNTSTVGAISIGSTVLGNIELPNDADWFKVSLTAGTVYLFSMAGASSGAGTLGGTNGYPYLSLYSPSGLFLDSAASGSATGEPAMSFTPTSSGTYYLAASDLGASHTGTYRINVLGSQINTIIGTSNSDSFVGSSANETIYGLAGNDTIRGSGGDDIIDGGSGTDTAMFAGNRASFSIMRTATGYRVAGASEGTDSLIGVERLAFNDGAINVEYTDVVQQLYVAYFGRAADSGAMTNFTNALAAFGLGSDIQSINAAYDLNSGVKALIDSFGVSAESNALYTGDTSSFVTAIYQNVLDRAPDSGGLNFWATAISNGTLTRSHAALSLMAGALVNTTTQGLLDAALVNNKIRIASNFTFAIDTLQEVQSYSGDSAATTVRNMLASVSASTDCDSFQSTVTSTLAGLSSNGQATTAQFMDIDHGGVQLIGLDAVNPLV